MSLVENLRRSSEAFPDRTAMAASDGAISYASLWQRAQSVAAYLVDHGLHAGDRVAIALDNSATFVALYYGVLSAQGIAVPLNLAARGRELGVWLAHSEPRMVFGDPNNMELQGTAAACGIPLIDPATLDWSVPTAVPLVLPAAASPATLIYTSGTSGAPKGVLLSHGNLASNTSAIVSSLDLRAGDSIVLVLPLYYSYGASVLHTHLAVGGTVFVQPGLTYPHRVVEELASRRATGFAGVPATFALLLGRVALERYDLSALRYVTQAGGPMPPALIERFCRTLPRVRFYVMYGQTEASARLSCLPPEQLARRRGSVGLPIPGVQLEIRAENGFPVAAGELGEVWARGENVMQGYWRDEVASATALRDGWLRTGDMGYQDTDAYLYLLGRRSEMIKTGAHRVHPEDIEAALLEMPEISEVAVVGMPDELLGEVIKAIAVRRTGSQVDDMAVKRHCRATLATYKVPKIVEFRASLPRLASGKVNRRELASGGTDQ